MTCSTSIVHFNFSLNPEIKLSSLDNDKFKSLNESSQNLFVNCSTTNGDLDHLSRKSGVKQMIKNRDNFELQLPTTQAAFNEPPQSTYCNSNMNNGLSNGHALNLDYGLSGNSVIPQSNSSCSISSTELSNAVCINPLSSTSSSYSISTLRNNSDLKMGLLNTHDKDNLPQNLLFLKENKIENGQKVEFNSDTGWSELKPNLLNNVNILPQLNSTEDDKLVDIKDDKVLLTCNDVNKNENEKNSEPYLINNKNSPEELNNGQNFDLNFQNDDLRNLPPSQTDEFSVDLTSKSLDLSHQEPTSNNPTDSVPINSDCSDLCKEQQTLHQQCYELIKRARRVQIQQTHRNLTKQMKLFVSRQQKLNLVNCQRNFDFSKFINVSDHTSQLKSYLLQKDSNPSKNEKLVKSELNSTNFISNIQPIRNNCNIINNSSLDALRHKIVPNKSNVLNQPQTSQLCSSQKSNSSDFPLSNLSFSFSPFPSDVQVNISSLNQERPSNLYNISQKTLSQENKDKILSTIDTLQYNLRHLESKYDSDATDSSSGSESCDELEENDFKNSTYAVSETQISSLPPSIVKRHLAIRNRSSWKWCTERSSIASRWSWLQAQVTDLETKLRQQNDIFRHLRATKGSVIFGEDDKVKRKFPSSSSINATHVNLNNYNHQSSSQQSSSLSQGNIASFSLENTSQNSQPENNEQDVTLEDDGVCMRTIPYVSMKRRKLVRSENTLSLAMKKSVKYSSIQCSCNIYPSYVPPCVICNGRYSYMHSIDTEFMPYYERISLLDSSCHPVLCLPNDVPLGVHFMQFLKRENINSKPVLLRNNKKKKINNLIHTTSPSTPDFNQKSKKLLTLNSLSKPKKKVDKSKKRRLSADRLSSGCSSRAESPIPSPCPSETSSNGTSSLTPLQTPTTPSAPLQRRRRSEQHAFDINNIVIPYSIAAATRVERLQYKEIITPKWRINEEFSIPPPENIKRQIINNKEITLDEDISQATFELRHSKCEETERQRIMSYYVGLTKNQNPRKGTSRVRFESKSDSVDNLIQDSCNSKVKSKGNNDYGYERKRHSSISKFWISNREDSLDEEIRPIVPPFELRQFPLPDSLYELMVQESNMPNEAEEQTLFRDRRDSAKNSTDHIDSTDDGTHASNSMVSSPSNTEMDINDEDVVKDHLYPDDELTSGEKDDPEWKPPS